MAVTTGSRYRTATGTGTLAAVILVLAFGNPAYVDWTTKNTNPNTAGGWFLRLLTWPAWRFDAKDPVRDVFAADIKAILLIALAAGLLAVITGALSAARASLSQLLAGWSAFIFAAALAGLIAAFIQSNPSLLGAFQAAGAGTIYGMFVGWIVGIAVLAGRG